VSARVYLPLDVERALRELAASAERCAHNRYLCDPCKECDEMGQRERAPRVITRVMDDGIKTKDGAA
jgi:hypothetical protein